jgi:hypothetical protein
MKKIFISPDLVISILFLIIVIGCKDPCKGKDTDAETITYTIEEDAKSKFPFKDRDTQIYISNIGDTAVLFGRLYAGYESKSAPNTIECFKPITWNAEKLRYYATGTNLELNKIEFILGAQFENAGENVIEFWISGNIGGGGGYYIESLNNEVKYKDSIIFNGASIYGVSLKGPIANLIYNYQYGFLKIEYLSGKSWKKIIK